MTKAPAMNNAWRTVADVERAMDQRKDEHDR